jgi:hypothetical protein
MESIEMAMEKRLKKFIENIIENEGGIDYREDHKEYITNRAFKTKE